MLWKLSQTYFNQAGKCQNRDSNLGTLRKANLCHDYTPQRSKFDTDFNLLAVPASCSTTIQTFNFPVNFKVQGGSNMTGTNCDFFYTQIVPVIFEPPCTLLSTPMVKE